MNEQPRGRFTRREDSEPAQRRGVAETRASFIDCLDDIGSYLEEARRGGRRGFEPRTARYAAASLAVIRAAALFENDDFDGFLRDIPEMTRRGITSTRNIVAHAGYATMDHVVFWQTIDVHLPALLVRMRGAV